MSDQYQQGPPGPGGPQPPVDDRDTTGFFGALFDFTFTHFVTPKLIRFVYILATIVVAVMWLIWIFVGFQENAALGIAALIIGPVVLIIYLALIRMTLEIYMSIVRMSEDIHHRLPPRV